MGERWSRCGRTSTLWPSALATRLLWMKATRETSSLRVLAFPPAMASMFIKATRVLEATRGGSQEAMQSSGTRFGAGASLVEGTTGTSARLALGQVIPRHALTWCAKLTVILSVTVHCHFRV